MRPLNGEEETNRELREANTIIISNIITIIEIEIEKIIMMNRTIISMSEVEL